MQTVPRVVTPRLIEIGRKDSIASAGSVQVEQEISVVSRSRSQQEMQQRNPVFSTTSSVSNGVKKSNSGRPLGLDRKSSRNRWKSEFVRTMSPAASEYDLDDLDDLDDSRESMRALMDFLRTKEPPAGNFMSMNESGDDLDKRSSFRLFKRKSREPKSPKLMKLPDSAISARTIHGTRHIAISIPIEHHPETSKLQGLLQKKLLESAKPAKPAHREAIVVPKPAIPQPTKLSPLTEVHENTSPRQPDGKFLDVKRDSRNSRTNYTLISKDHPTITEPTPTAKRTHIAVSPDDVRKRDSQFGDLRHSGGTIYSTASLNEPSPDSEDPRKLSLIPSGGKGNHSREISSVSTAPSEHAIRVKLPPRASGPKGSGPSSPPQTQSDIAQAYDEQLRQKATELADALSNNLRRNSTPKTSPIPSPPLATTAAIPEEERGRKREPAPKVHYANLPEMMEATPTPSSELPMPVLTNGQKVIPSIDDDVSGPLAAPSPPVSMVRRERDGLRGFTIAKSHSTMIRDPNMDVMAPDSIAEMRKEVVRAKKERDIAALREKSASPKKPPEQIPDTGTVPEEQTQPTIEPKREPSPKHSLRHTSTKEHPVSVDQMFRKGNTLSQVMTVAQSAPYLGEVHMSDLALDSSSTERSIEYSTPTQDLTPTPPRSACDSDSDTIKQLVNKPSLPSSPSHSGLDTRRQERRLHRNSTLRQKELDNRVSRLEKDNAMLMRTLNGIARSFGELSRLLPAVASTAASNSRGDGERDGMRLGGGGGRIIVPESPMLSPYTDGSGSLGTTRDLEPVMRDLLGNAGRVSEEGVWKRGRGYEDFEDGDGESIVMGM